MSDTMITGIFTLGGVIVGAVIGIVTILVLKEWKSKRFRVKQDVPNILGKWQCQWFDDAGEPDKPKVEDSIEIERWTTNGEFRAFGHQPQFNLIYPLHGEVDASRVVTLTYRAARYPYEPNRGVVCMEVSRDGNSMEGRWFGRRFSGNLSGGMVKCVRESIRNTKC
jgi:hypothetical protein